MRPLGRAAVAVAAIAAAASSLIVPYPALGEEIVIPLNGSLSGLGPRGGNYYRGQTFLGPGGLAGELTVYAASPDRGKAKARLLLIEVDTSSGIHPTNVLFESEILPIGHGFPPTPITVNLGGIPLEAGETYAWILDTLADYDPLNEWGGEVGADFGASDGDGVPISLPTGPFPPPGDRNDHFAMNWFTGDSGFLDFAYRLTFSPFLAESVAVDIRPQGCPNPLPIPSNGTLPVSIVGTEDLDVYRIDQASIRLEGVAPRRSAFEDVATPFEPFVGKSNLNDCHDYGADGFDDLTLKFDLDALVTALGDVQDGEVAVLRLTGNLLPEFGAREIVGEDVVLIKRPETGE